MHRMRTHVVTDAVSAWASVACPSWPRKRPDGGWKDTDGAEVYLAATPLPHI